MHRQLLAVFTLTGLRTTKLHVLKYAKRQVTERERERERERESERESKNSGLKTNRHTDREDTTK